MSRQLLGQTAAYTFATMISRGATVVMLVVLPAFVSVADYGVLGLVATASSLVPVLCSLETGQALARYFPTADTADKARYLRTAWTFTLLMLAAAALLSLAFSAPLTSALLGPPRLLPTFCAAVLLCSVNTLFLFVQNQFRWEFRATDFVATSIVFSVATLVLSLGLMVLLTDPLLGVIVGQAIGAAAGLAVGARRLRGRLGLAIVPAALRQMLRFSLPLVPASLALFTSAYGSRIILQHIAGLEDLGVFTWASQLASLPALLMIGVQGAVTPYVMRHHAEPNCPVLLARGFEAVLAIELTLCLGLGLLAPYLIEVAGYTDYRAAGPLVVIIAPAALLLQLYVFAPGFAVAERNELQLAVSVASAVVVLGANYLMIGRLGVIGAAWAALLSASAFLGLWMALSQRLYPLPLRVGRLLCLLATAVAIAVIGTRLPPGGLAQAGVAAALAASLLGVAVALDLLNLRWVGAFKSAVRG